MPQWQTLKASTSAYLKTPGGQRTSKIARRLLWVVIMGVLAYQLTRVGWQDIWGALPRTPWFYLIFLLLYFMLPITETVIFHKLWRVHFWKGLPAVLKKRVYNKDVLGYSGDVYLFMWARKHVQLKERQVFGTLRDNAVVSAVASTLFAVAVLGTFFFTGQIALLTKQIDHPVAYALAGGAAAIVLAVIALRFRRTLFLLPGRTLGLLLGIHLGRQVLVTALQIVQWSVVIPDVALDTWFTLISVQIVTSRLPFLPARDLIFLGASVELAQVLHVSSAAMAGMLLVSSVLDKGLNLVLFGIASLRTRREGQNMPEGPMPPAQAHVLEHTESA